MYENIKTQPVNYPQNIDNDLKDLFQKLLMKDPEKRITIPKIKIHPWIVKEEIYAETCS